MSDSTGQAKCRLQTGRGKIGRLAVGSKCRTETKKNRPGEVLGFCIQMTKREAECSRGLFGEGLCCIISIASSVS